MEKRDDYVEVEWPGQPEYRCPRHGSQGNYVGMAFSFRDIHKNYCLQCWHDMVAANCCELVKVK